MVPAFLRRCARRLPASGRTASLLVALSLAACTGGVLPAPDGAAPSAAAASPPAAPPSGSGGGARGGATTAAARGEPVEVPPDLLMQARADCWSKVEGQKALRGIDQRVAFVDKCVAEQMKPKPGL